jgi:cation diffusion facilitator CzcD-associated flavoprotein CzcO
MPNPAAFPDLEVLIIGSGFGGLSMAISLKKSGSNSFVVLERGPDVGGTWRVNTYPGCACDIPSHLYSYSFEPNSNWSRLYPTQAEIWKYLQDCARKYALGPHIRFSTEVREAIFDERTHFWRVTAHNGETFTARAVVSCMGGLSRPSYPALPGLEQFVGPRFHSSEWDHSVDLQGRRVAVVGTGASSIPFVPQIADKVAQLSVYQRTPPWILPKFDRRIQAWEKTLFRRLPGYIRMFRALLYFQQEIVGLGYTVNPKYMNLLKRLAMRHLKRSVPDPALRRKLTPDYQIGCKRVLLSNEYLPALCRSNVEVVDEGIREVRANSIVTQDGRERPADAMIYGTGFRSTDLLSPVRFVGREGVTLNETWRNGAEAYYGVTVAGYPNLFLMIGPNSRVGHNSIVFMIEAQTHYIMQCLRLMRGNPALTIEVRSEAQARFNRDLQARMPRTVYASGCSSWYIDARGRNTILWPGFSSRYWMDTRSVVSEDYVAAQSGT